MIQIRRSEERGHRRHGWLDTYHSFSFSDYYDPDHMGVSHLRVLNDDRIAPATGFPTHPHQDMEIVTYVMEGALAHRDSLGNASQISAGEVQRMTAGTGIRHSEANPSQREPVHLIQIWILPDRKGLTPGYEQRQLIATPEGGVLELVASPMGADEQALKIHQDTRLYAGRFSQGQSVEWTPSPDRMAYLHVARGSVTLNGHRLGAGDAATVRGESLCIEGGDMGEVLLFDLADSGGR